MCKSAPPNNCQRLLQVRATGDSRLHQNREPTAYSLCAGLPTVAIRCREAARPRLHSRGLQFLEVLPTFPAQLTKNLRYRGNPVGAERTTVTSREWPHGLHISSRWRDRRASSQRYRLLPNVLESLAASQRRYRTSPSRARGWETHSANGKRG